MSRRGTVVRASPATFAGLEKAALRQNAKGVYIERGPHSKAQQIQTWLNGQEEDDLMFGEFASAQLLVAKPNEECDDSDCDDTDADTSPDGTEVCDGTDNDCVVPLAHGDTCTPVCDDGFTAVTASAGCVNGNFIPGECRCRRGHPKSYHGNWACNIEKRMGARVEL